MKTALKAAFWAAFLFSAAVSAFAQGAVQQSGPVVPGHLAAWGYNGIIRDAGNAPPLPKTTVNGLGACGPNQTGQIAVVTDAMSPTYGATLAGGGSTVAIALCNGSTWSAH